MTHDTNEEATEKYYSTTLKGDRSSEKKVLKPVIAGKNWFMTGCEFYNPSGFGYDACLKGVSRKKYLDIIWNAFVLKS